MKMLAVCLILTTLNLVNLQHVSLPRAARHGDCRKSDLRQIKRFFKNTTIVRIEDATEVQYCAFMSEESGYSSHAAMDLETVIDLYTTFDNVNSYTYIEPQGPVTHDGALSINDEELLPLYQVADIRKKHLTCQNSFLGFGDEVNAQMKLMSLRNTDIKGYLLPHSLGGDSSAFNVIPMAVNVYWHQYIDTKEFPLGFPKAYWRSNEYWIRRFLLHFYPNGRVMWKIAVQYDENIFLNPKRFRSYRPLSFSLHYIAYTNEYDDTTIYYESPMLTFRNDNHYSCKSIIPCHKDTDVGQYRDHNCDIKKTEPQGTIRNDILFERNWPARHLVAFPYYMQGKAYFYAQNEDLKWFIHELLPDGKVGGQTATGAWNVRYNYSFPYFINGSQYMYAHSNDDKSWFVRQLLPFGKMGEITDNGTWDHAHCSCHWFTLNGKHYWLTQWSNGAFSIKYLLPYGKITKRNVWLSVKLPYSPLTVLFSFHINNSLKLMRHEVSKRSIIYSTETVFATKKLHLSSGEEFWNYAYNIVFTYTLSGKRFIYGLTADPPYHWFIRRMLSNGTLVKTELSSDVETASYPIAFPFLINGRQFLYKQNKETFACKIQEFL